MVLAAVASAALILSVTVAAVWARVTGSVLSAELTEPYVVLPTAGLLLALFRLVFSFLGENRAETHRIIGTLREERDQANERADYQERRANHYYARWLGDPNAPPLPDPLLPRLPEEETHEPPRRTWWPSKLT